MFNGALSSFVINVPVIFDMIFYFYTEQIGYKIPVELVYLEFTIDGLDEQITQLIKAWLIEFLSLSVPVPFEKRSDFIVDNVFILTDCASVLSHCQGARKARCSFFIATYKFIRSATISP